MPATPQGAANAASDPDTKDGEVAVETRSQRDIMLENLGERQEENRRTMIAEGLAEDAGAAAIQGRIEQQQIDNRTAAEEAGELEPIEVVEPELTDTEVETGVASVEPMHEPEVEGQLPEDLQNDPLADFIVMDGETPKVALRINGQDMLMDVDEAKRRLQIRTAAEIDLQNARNFKRELDQRADELSAGERALQARMGTTTPEEDPNAAPTQAALSEDEIRGEAVDIFKTAFSGTEDEAADKLTKLLTRVQTPVVQPALPIDETAIVRKAATVAVGAIREDGQKKDLVEGIQKFRDDYPDIVGDATLYRLCDDMTDGIAVENPMWSKSQVMFEAGKRTRKWVEDLRGTSTTVETTDDVDVTTEEPEISEPSLPPKAHDRHARKTGLVRIPQAAAGAVSQQEETVDERPMTPAEALAETRKARGQPV